MQGINKYFMIVEQLSQEGVRQERNCSGSAFPREEWEPWKSCKQESCLDRFPFWVNHSSIIYMIDVMGIRLKEERPEQRLLSWNKSTLLILGWMILLGGWEGCLIHRGMLEYLQHLLTKYKQYLSSKFLQMFPNVSWGPQWLGGEPLVWVKAVNGHSST